jgi:hypothetical protein
MTRVTGYVLKSSNVEVKGKFKLELMQTTAAPLKDSKRSLAAPQVRIVEKHAEFAVIEVTCSCGDKISLRCKYGEPESPDKNAETQNTTADSPPK